MTAAEAVELFMAVVVEQVGYTEKKSNAQLDDKTANAGSGNYTKYARDLDALGYYNGKKQGYEWCCVMPDDCRVKVFGMDLAQRIMGQPAKGLGAGVKYMYQYLQALGQVFETPQRGDQSVFVTYNADGSVKSWQHTGVVESVADGYVHTIEGNTSPGNGVVANGGMVCRKQYPLGDKRIYGYVRPLWELAAEEMTEREECDMTKDEVVELVNAAVKTAVAEAIQSLTPTTYHKVEELPDWAQGPVEELIEEGVLEGDGVNEINLTNASPTLGDAALAEKVLKKLEEQ